MGSDDPDTATGRATQPGRTAYEVGTGESFDDSTASAGITITSTGEVDSVRVRVPGMEEFEYGPDKLREWLHQYDLVRTPQQWTAIDQQIMDAIQHGREREHHVTEDGYYDSDQYRVHGTDPTDPAVEHQNEQQSQDWADMTHAWEQFRQQCDDLRSIAGTDADAVLRQIGHTITALNIIVSPDWAGYCLQEFGSWEALRAEGMDTNALHEAADSIADGGQTLYQLWHAAIEAGNYHSYSMSPAEQEYLALCTQARESLPQHQ